MQSRLLLITQGGRNRTLTIRKRWPWVKHLLADGGYDRRTLMDKAT